MTWVLMSTKLTQSSWTCSHINSDQMHNISETLPIASCTSHIALTGQIHTSETKYKHGPQNKVWFHHNTKRDLRLSQWRCWRHKSSGMWCCILQWVVSNIWKHHVPSCSRVKQCKKPGSWRHRCYNSSQCQQLLTQWHITSQKTCTFNTIPVISTEYSRPHGEDYHVPNVH